MNTSPSSPLAAGFLSGKTAIVTGASSGIGRAIAVAYAAAGASVFIADITETPKEGGETTAALITKAGGYGQFVATDIASAESVRNLIETATGLTGRLDILVNNAATYVSKKLTETTDEEWSHVVSVNLTGLFNCSKQAIEQMLRQDPVNEVRGRIINITSQHGMVSAPKDFAYGVTKAAGVYATRQIAADYAKDLIICNAIAPGKILTGKPGVAVDPDALAYSKMRTPMPRFGEPQDIANAALYLASDLSSYTTGINLMVDGGWMAA
ncbi:beta-ketoacyl-ACP reductase [Kaistia sp. 32K]|uniref:SDR family NAD(P)-dependent oxidoreductase n=1 Tax=Kaistia sp. 32K TaxID=2795690 RepID=UPI0019152B7C|nr:SDR family oxidoreductase [Kaistia sp. 32K]BCP54009.1 beta-ketoacyl-ACP reductase [Kaistia sp. 32K]